MDRWGIVHDISGFATDPLSPPVTEPGARPAPVSSAPMLREIAAHAGLNRIDVVAWRDLDDPEAGGSELHAHEIMRRWAAAGLEVTSWTSQVDGAASEIIRDGYRVRRRAGRYAVFPRTAADGWRRMQGDGLVEIWNGMPFFSPLWSRRPRVVFLHHVHAEMWQMVLSPRLARLGHAIEHRLAPPVYRRSRIITLSESAKADIVERLHIAPDRVTVASPGIDGRFSPGGDPAPAPLVVAVGRLVPVKRFDCFIDAMVALHERRPDLRAVVVGEGYERPALEAKVAAAGAGSWLTLPGRLSDAELVDLYRRAWLVVATSVKEGWGMTLTESAACGTPSVAWRIPGHLDAVLEGESGMLVDSVPELVEACLTIVQDPLLRRRLAKGALAQAENFSWEQTATAALEALAGQVHRSG